ncbi:MAG: hypothetical protein ABIJ45_12575 [Candidatus Zixiibacteriota bacterium]
MQKPLITIIGCLIIVMIILTGCGIENREIHLAYKFNPDKIYHYKYQSQNSYKAYENGQLVYTGDSSFNVVYTQEVVEMIDSLCARLRFEYISKLDGQNPSNWETEYIMFTNGEITGVFDDFDTSNATMQYYKELFEQTSPAYPDEPVKVEFTWKNSTKVLLNGGNTDASTTYKVKAFVREAGYDCAVIEYKGTMILPLPPDGTDDKAVTKGSDHVTVEGVVYFAYKEGIVIKEEETSHLLREGTVTIDNEAISFKFEEDRTYNSILTRIDG